MYEVPLYRLYLLRAMYFLLAIAMGVPVWQDIVTSAATWDRNEGVVRCMLGALAALSLLGLRYPLQMLPLLLWEAAWKTIWLAFVPLPQWWANGAIDASIQSTTFDCAFVVLAYIAIPWGHVLRRYAGQPGERWTSRAARGGAAAR